MTFIQVGTSREVLALSQLGTERADASCFASESITDIYGLGKSWPQTDLDPVSSNVLFLP